MPVTRRSTRATSSSKAGGEAKQAKLNFNNKITKPLPSRAHPKDKVAKVEEALVRTATPSPAPEPVSVKVEKEEKAEVKLSPAEVKASKISQAAINRYWKSIEESRLAKEVHKKHTAGLTTGEKVLRYWDVSSQYGPCVGITRLKRWQRAERLGLNPPIEVLAVLVKEERSGERAHLDELLNSTAVGERE
ncbi:DNA polymerase delta, subunit 4-domain-containing protein [Apiosordaria backusii]|uniref:DNA polymerase delta, subunit 4-domain-containing protein n=1 Tax=Apiosordaria backusii TaxID=314023 RepID=A0AA40EM29_9PEZI|nr:DNA polymerase delta, subunit 4-domain-containing protein [Apiosordaria backusii]